MGQAKKKNEKLAAADCSVKDPPVSTDALSDVLSAVQPSGSVFFDVTAESPWVAEAPPAAQIAKDVTPGAQHVIEYHVVTRASAGFR